ncbi:hypothetical protein ccbrp13_55090 [Ktedonobacteria bacterium brp13]|nr:hypothetical protein ccbrp13_55090 [Ktedonobacteria bacterium brp13]
MQSKKLYSTVSRVCGQACVPLDRSGHTLYTKRYTDHKQEYDQRGDISAVVNTPEAVPVVL